MLMVLYFYLQVMLLYSTPILFLWSVFIIKRGIRRSRKEMRETGMALLYITSLKLLIYDASQIAQQNYCVREGYEYTCNTRAEDIFCYIAWALIIPVTYLMHKLFKKLINMNRPARRSMTEMKIRMWANIAMFCVFLLAMWLIVPWVGYLTVGHAPAYLINSGWQVFGMICSIMILVTFWRYEDCSLVAQTPQDKRNSHKSWIPRDTLWFATALLIFIYPVMSFSENVFMGR